MGRVGSPLPTHHRSDVDDLARPLRHQVWQDVLAAEERSLEVDVHDEVPFLFLQLNDRSERGHAGIVDEDVDSAELLRCGLYHFRW